MLEFCGWLGAILFSVCGIPQAYASYKNKNSNGISTSFIIMWFFAEIFTIIYIFPSNQIPLLMNYFVNLIIVLIIAYYKFFPKIDD